MKSGHVVDTASRIEQLNQFFRERNRETSARAQTSALAKRDSYVADSTARPGAILSYTEIASRLRRLNPSLLFEQSRAYPDQGGIYLISPGDNPDDFDHSCRNRRFITGMGWGMVAENTIPKVVEDEFGEPVVVGIIKGWRDTLKVLIELRLITVPAAERAFGSGGPKWWKRIHAL